jgi:hypothetical protein
MLQTLRDEVIPDEPSREYEKGSGLSPVRSLATAGTLALAFAVDFTMVAVHCLARLLSNIAPN